MNYKHFLFVIFFFFTNNLGFGAIFNGIDIPDDLDSKFKEYRYRQGRAFAASVDSTYEYSVEEFDRWLKSRVEFDSTHFCPICKVFFPIRSNSFKKNISIKDNKLCLDGYPKIIYSPLPPECPYCLCVCPDGEFSYQGTVELTYSVFGHTAQYLQPCDRYILFVETLHRGLSDYEKFQIYFKYAVCGIYKDSEIYLKKAYNAIDTFIAKHFKEELEKDEEKEKDSLYYWNFNIFFQRVDLLRQIGDFKQASELLSELDKYNKYSYRSVILEFERKLILEKNTKRIERPFGNLLHNAIKDCKNVNELNISTEELSRLSRQTNINNNTPFQQAILEKKYEYLQFLLKSVPDILKIEETDDDFKPLHYAAKVGDVRIIELLLNSGCDIDGKSDQIQTPIFLAIRFGQYNAVCYLIRHNANLEVKDQEYNKPLQAACYSCNKDGIKILEKLLEKENKSSPNYKNELQKCLQVAICYGNLEALKFFKKNGIAIDFSKIPELSVPSPNTIDYLSKEKGSDTFLYNSFRSALNYEWQNHLEAYRKAGLYDKFLKRIEKEK